MAGALVESVGEDRRRSRHLPNESAMRTILLLVLLLAPAREENAKAPDLNMESNWGTVKQDGPNIAIGGHAHWTASGEIRKDGKVYLMWQTVASGEFAPALYEVKDGAMVGKWGWLKDVEFDDDGNITGELCDDTISKVK